MSYGNVYILSDIKKLKRNKTPKWLIIQMITNRLLKRYPDMKRKQARNIVIKNYEGKKTTLEDWKKV